MTCLRISAIHYITICIPVQRIKTTARTNQPEQTDGLLDSNRQFSALLEHHHIRHTFEVGPGSHEWDFWDTYIKHALEWLPLEGKEEGMSNGNVGLEGTKKRTPQCRADRHEKQGYRSFPSGAFLFQSTAAKKYPPD